MGNIVLEAQNVKKIYNYRTRNEFEALHNINFKVEEGEFVGIMGPSGSGKSTLINNISTLDLPTSGKVLINGQDVRRMSSNEVGRFRYKNLGFIFQSFNLLRTHTIYENIALPLSLAKVDPKEIEVRVTAAAKDLGIDTLLNKTPLECSTGQMQRTAIARALINEPTLIVADEPTGNLDSENSKSLMKLLQKLNKEMNCTIIMVSHDPIDVSYTEKVIYLRDGNIETTLEKGDMDQKSYYHKIVEMSSGDSEDLFG